MQWINSDDQMPTQNGMYVCKIANQDDRYKKEVEFFAGCWYIDDEDENVHEWLSEDAHVLSWKNYKAMDKPWINITDCKPPTDQDGYSSIIIVKADKIYNSCYYDGIQDCYYYNATLGAQLIVGATHWKDKY